MATMTNASIAALARQLVGDQEPYLPDEPTIAQFIDLAKDALQDRTGVPFVDSSEDLIAIVPTPLSNGKITGNCELDSRWREALAHYVAGLILSMPGANNELETAEFEMKRFKQCISGK